MTGTDKQIAWAAEIKAASIAAWHEIDAANRAQTRKSKARFVSNPDSSRAADNAAADLEAETGFDALVCAALSVTGASEWINSRAFGNVANPHLVTLRSNPAPEMREIVAEMLYTYRNPS